MDYTTMDRQQQNVILKQHGYYWRKITQDWLDDNDDFETTPGWYLYAPDRREVDLPRAFEEIERGVAVVAEEYRLAAEQERAETQKRRDLATWRSHLTKIIMHRGTRPNDEHTPDGDILLDTQDIYGGGDWFVVSADRIWYVRNNGMDGDNWSHNNVRTGGAGAIGWYIPFDEQIANQLRDLNRAELPGGYTWNAYWD